MKKINLTVANPCHENWEAMSPTEKGRFCSSCQKTVVDFTGMSDRQLAEFFKKPARSVCGRFYEDQLSRNIPLPAKRLPWVRHFFQLLLPAFLLTLKAQGQKTIRIGRVAPASDSSANKPKTNTHVQPVLNKVSGKVTDEKGDPVPHATVILKGTSQGVVCDSAGRFDLMYSQALPFILTISSVGYETIEHMVKDASANNLLLPVLKQGMMGEVVVVGYAINRKKRDIPLISWLKRDTVQQHLQIYPNPVRSNGNIIIESKKLEKGACTLQLTAMDGKMVCAKPIELENNDGLLRADLPALVPGFYLVTITQKKSKKVYTQKIQVL